MKGVRVVCDRHDREISVVKTTVEYAGGERTEVLRVLPCDACESDASQDREVQDLERRLESLRTAMSLLFVREMANDSGQVKAYRVEAPLGCADALEAVRLLPVGADGGLVSGPAYADGVRCTVWVVEEPGRSRAFFVDQGSASAEQVSRAASELGNLRPEDGDESPFWDGRYAVRAGGIDEATLLEDLSFESEEL